MADFTFVKSLIGHTPEVQYATADEALEAGDIGNFDTDGEIEKVDDGATEDDLVLVLEDASADDTNIPYIWLDPWVVIRGTMKGTLGDVGDLVQLDVTSGVIKFEAATTSTIMKFQIRRLHSATEVDCVRFYGTITT